MTSDVSAVAGPATGRSMRTTRPTGKLTEISWLPGMELRLDDWIEQGRKLGVVGRASAWWIGDWLRYGNSQFGERYPRASRITGYDVQTLMNMVYVASAIPPAERREKLSWSHHAELAALTSEERAQWLDHAEANRLSVRCLRAAVRSQHPRRRRAAKGKAEALPAAASEHEATGRCPHCGHSLLSAHP